MPWILILVLNIGGVDAGPSTLAIQFDGQLACERALAAVKALDVRFRGVCVRRGV